MENQFLKLNLQHFATSKADVAVQDFNPDHVMMHEMKDGTLLNEFQAPLMEQVMNNSAVFQLGKYKDMKGKSELTFSFFGDKPGAYWVGEGRKIKTTTATMLTATMRAHKVATIVVVSREYLEYTYRQFFEAIKPDLAKALWTKVDEATILGVDNPYAKSIESVTTANGNVVAEGFTYDGILAAEDKVIEGGSVPNAFISQVQNRKLLRGAVNEKTNDTMYDRKTNEIDGLPVIEMDSAEYPANTAYAGDFNHLYFGIPYNIHYRISEEAQLSEIKNADGTPVNLYEQELIALRVTMDVATHIAKEDAFVKITAPAEEPVA
ncbi:phage major capsid protein [Macrococcoides bohemicum]|uniref:phage major capsid protein n=1 Tax=Macrococcoides bohemicum TaxID=1903056 RepID=UPI0028A28676|nr:phage major capsid protein [Macrococcus bohemicus]